MTVAEVIIKLLEECPLDAVLYRSEMTDTGEPIPVEIVDIVKYSNYADGPWKGLVVIS